MRILQVVQSLAPGGAERVVLSLVRGGRDAGHEISVAAAPGAWAAELLDGHTALPMLERHPGRLPRAAATIRRAIAAGRVDLVHAHNPGMAAAVALATLRGRHPAALVSVHGVPDDDYGSAARVLRLAGLPVVACGPGVATALREHGCPVRATILNGIAPAAPPGDRRSLLAGWGLDPGRPFIVAAGRLVPQKNHALAVEAMRSVPDASLVILGEGPLRPALEGAIDGAGLGDRVRLAGYRPDAASILAAGDAVVVASRWEGLPLVGLEALAARRPLVATAVRGIRELFEDERECLLVPPGDPEAMAGALRRVLDDPALAEGLGGAGWLLAQRHTEQRMVEEFLALYEELRAPARRRGQHRRADPPAPGPAEDRVDWASKKILFVIQPAVGGSVRHVTDLLSWVTALGARVQVVCDPSLSTMTQVRSMAVVWPRRMRRRPEAGDVATLAFLVRLLRREHFDLVHAHSSKAGSLVRIACCAVRPRPAVLYTPHGFGFHNPELPPVIRPAFWLVERSLAPLGDGIVALCGEEEAHSLRLARREAVFLATNGVAVTPVPERSQEAASLTLAYVGRLSGVKGVDVLIAALPMVFAAEPGARLWIIGDGPDRQNLEVQVNGLGLAAKVDFLGQRDDVADRWGDIDIVIIPSRSEAQPYVLLEAMMAGRPVVASAVGGMKDLIDAGRDGLLVPPESPEALAAAVIRLAQDPMLRGALGEGAAARARDRVSLDAMFSSHERIYRHLLSGAGAAEGSPGGPGTTRRVPGR